MPVLPLLLGVFVVTFGLAAAVVVQMRSRLESEAELSPLLREERVSSISFWARLLNRFQASDTLRSHIQQAGLNWSVGRLTAMMLLSGTVGFAVTSSISWLPSFASIGGTLGLAASPYLYVRGRRRRRFRAFESQFPDALDSIARALRAGHPFSAGLDLLGSEYPAPLGLEMRRTYEEWKLGSSWEQALAGLAERVPLPSVSLFSGAVKLQSRTGGKLNEVLAKLSETMREANALEDEVRAIAAHGKLTGAILSALPLFIAGMLFFVNPDYLLTLTRHEIGRTLIAVSLALLIAAHFVIRKLVEIRL
ncbi:MAG: type II secretion system F family protein [Bryobacteraceae bacterium]|nr:type II secretion system F family protein [Bryobacteraceae bacterium]